MAKTRKEKTADSRARSASPYGNYLNAIAQRLESHCSGICSQHNFDLGPEFEIALCYALREILPQRFGVCRGYVVPAEGEPKGDDIIIYDRDNFPILRMIEQDRFDRKQHIAVEAVYAYLEAKHTLCLEGRNGQSLWKAIRQVGDVKSIPREPFPWSYYDPYFAAAAETARPQHWPPTRNQLFGAVIARQVRLSKNSAIVDDAAMIQKALETARIGPPQPDLIVAGPNVLCLPAIHLAYETPFFIEGVSKFAHRIVQGSAMALGIISLLYALDMMRLNKMNWQQIIGYGLGLKVVDKRGWKYDSLEVRPPLFAIRNPDGYLNFIPQSDGGSSFLPLFSTFELAVAFITAAKLDNFVPAEIQDFDGLANLARLLPSRGVD